MQEEKVIGYVLAPRRAEVGDVVRLKAGGPLMTVVTTEADVGAGYTGPPAAGCMWHLDDGAIEDSAFPIAALDFITSGTEPPADKCAVKVDPTPVDAEGMAKEAADVLEEKLGEQFGTERKQSAEPGLNVAAAAFAAAAATGELVG